MIAIGWKEMGDLSVLAPDRESYRDKYLAVFPDAKKGSVATSSGMLFRFVHEMQIGDYVVFPSKTDRMVNIGVVESEYQYSPDAIEYKQQRSVNIAYRFGIQQEKENNNGESRFRTLRSF